MEECLLSFDIGREKREIGYYQDVWMSWTVVKVSIYLHLRTGRDGAGTGLENVFCAAALWYTSKESTVWCKSTRNNCDCSRTLFKERLTKRVFITTVFYHVYILTSPSNPIVIVVVIVTNLTADSSGFISISVSTAKEWGKEINIWDRHSNAIHTASMRIEIPIKWHRLNFCAFLRHLLPLSLCRSVCLSVCLQQIL